MSDGKKNTPSHIVVVEDTDDLGFVSSAAIAAFAKKLGEQVDPAAAAFYAAHPEFMFDDDEIEWDGAVPKGAD